MKEITYLKIRKNLFLFLAGFGLDRLAKYLILHSSGNIYLTSWLSFDITINRGIAWGLFHTASTLGFMLIVGAIGLLITALVGYATWQIRQGKFAAQEMLILAGAISNLLDRLIYSGVIDFIHIRIAGWSFPIFNVADILIVIGAVWILLAHDDQ